MTDVNTKNCVLSLRECGEEKNVVKGCESMSGWYWFATEINEKTATCFGYVQGTYPEWGYFSVAELDSIPMVWEIKDCDLPHSGRREY